MTLPTPLFARSGKTQPGGKMTARLDIPCTEEMSDAVTAFAYLNRKPKAEVAREALELGLVVMRHMNDRHAAPVRPLEEPTEE
jgi:hypothetical protein